MTSRSMGDSTVRMREYVGFIMIFMGTDCQLPYPPSFDAMHVTPWQYWCVTNGHTSKGGRESAIIRHIPQVIIDKNC